MKVLVVGASRRTGAAIVQELAETGHDVTGFARSSPAEPVSGARYVSGDVLDAAAIASAVAGQDAVIVALGISDNVLAVRLGRSSTPLDVRSAGTLRVIEAMHAAGAKRLVVVSAFGVGETYARLPLQFKLFFTLVLRPQIRDTERQEAAVVASGLDWTILRPVNLRDGDGEGDGAASVSTDDTVAGMSVARRQVAAVAASALGDGETVGRRLSISAE